MLSGLKDELIPKEHMRALWEAVAKRGEKKTSGGSEYKVGLERAKYMEFEYGGHSKQCAVQVQSMPLTNTSFWTDDTCVQTGYWPAVADFIASLGGTPTVEKASL
jgi:abhydrolase domain-containing protein 13